MEVNIKEFLSGFSAEELRALGILHPGKRGQLWLMGPSVNPLIELMQENKTTKLFTDDGRWFLAVDGTFANPASTTGDARHGLVRDLQKRGSVFDNQNRNINPHFMPVSGLIDEEDDLSEDQLSDSSQLKFGLERDLQSALRANIEQLESGFKIIDGGTERTVEAGRVDITALDAEGRLVVIELKAGTSELKDIGQLLSYMGSIENEEGREIRGILVARDFNDRLVLAARAVPNVALKEYSFSFSFKNR